MKESDKLEEPSSKKLLEITRERARKQALKHFRHTKTCVLARELCLFVRTHRAAFEKKDVNECCRFISTLCKEAGCVEASELCAKAAEVVVGSEETYLELCEQSCKKCGESRLPQKRPPGKAVYDA